MKKPLLTISILCSGRPETEKCLQSLNTLRKRVPCELILVDTGCSEEMKKLLQSYGDRIIQFSWCSNFAKARNAGMRLARGQWFMFVDDDEWFMDTKAIEDFFLSGEYRDYGCASYCQRNYRDREGLQYSDNWVIRLTFLAKNVQFRGAIHEQFFPLFGPYKLIPATVEHYGYVYDSPEEERKHSERNRALLEKAVSEEPDNLRMWTHLAQEYQAGREFEKLRDLCLEALRKIEDADTIGANTERGCFYCGLLTARKYLGELKQEREDYERAVADRRNTDYCMAQLMTYGLDMAVLSGEREKMRGCCGRYLEIWERYRENENAFMVQYTPLVIEAFTVGTRNRMFCSRICLDLEDGITDSLKKYFDMLNWQEREVIITEEFLPTLVKAMAELPYEEIFAHAADILVNRPNMENFWEEIEKIEEPEELWRLGRVLSEVKLPSFGRYRQIVDVYMRNASGKKLRSLQTLREMMEEKGIGKESAQDGKGTLSVRQRYFWVKLKETAAVRAGMDKTGGLEEVKNLLGDYVSDCLDFYGEFYTERAFEGEMEFLPAPCRAAVKLREVLAAQEKDDWAAFSDAVKTVAGVFPDMSETLKMYAGLYAEERAARKDGRPASSEQPSAEIPAEMKILAGKIKAQIPILLSQGMAAEAQQVLQQLKMLTPGDEELVELEQKIKEKVLEKKEWKQGGSNP